MQFVLIINFRYYFFESILDIIKCLLYVKKIKISIFLIISKNKNKLKIYWLFDNLVGFLNHFEHLTMLLGCLQSKLSGLN